MISIPENLAQIAPILTKYLHPLLNWFSNYVFKRLIPPNSNHLLFILKNILDLSRLESACANYHKLNGKGNSVTHTVPKLLRAMLVKYLYDCSLRELEHKIRYDMLVKWFVGYPIFAMGPDHTTLQRFESYLIFNYPRLFFDTVLEQIDIAFPNDRKRTQIGDTFAMHANAALESLIKRLRHTTQELLFAYQAADPNAYASLWSQLDHNALFGSKDEGYLPSDEWHQQLLLTVDTTLKCLNLIQTPPTSTIDGKRLSSEQAALTKPVRVWIERLEKILADELRLERNENGRLIGIAFLSKEKRGKYPICSATDPDATIRNHGPGKKDFGYNVSVAVTIDFVREIQADTGSRPDASPIPELLQSQIEHHDVCPEKFIYDQAAGYGKTAHLVDEATDGHTRLVAKPMPSKRKKGRFAPEDFAVSEDGLELTCPNERTSRRKYRSGSGDGYNFHFVASQCLGCPLLKPCRGKKKRPTTRKSVFISDYRAEWNQLNLYSQTDDFKLDMSSRPQVERVIAGLVLHNGARRSRFRGQVKVDFQAKMCATAYNLKRWVSLLSGKQSKKRRRLGAPLPSMGEVGLLTA